MGQINLNEEEGQVLINLLEVSLRQGGFETAESAIYFKNKIQNSFKNIEVNDKEQE